MLGIVAGGSCVIDVNTIHYEVRDPYGNCIEVFKIFSPWPNIAKSLRIQ